MTLQILILIAGLFLIVGGAEILVDGSSSLARKMGISEFVIGLTIVGMGTSAPEMVVSFIGAVNGNADISIGNVVGSNIMNTLLIVARLFVLGMNRSLFGKGDNMLSRIDGAVMLLVFLTYMVWTFVKGKGNAPEAGAKTLGTGISILMTVGGIAALIFGGRLFVNSATAIAKMAGVSDKFIALTILAGGTSMPELATCVVAAIRKKGALALGNVIGSNIFNVLFILGGSALIRPMSMASMNMVDFGVLALSSLLLLLSCLTGRNNRIDRFDGTVFLLTEAGYLAWLFLTI